MSVDTERIKIRFPGEAWIDSWKLIANTVTALPATEVTYSYYGAASTKGAIFRRFTWNLSIAMQLAQVQLLREYDALARYNRQNGITPYWLELVDRTHPLTEKTTDDEPSLDAYDTPVLNDSGTITYVPIYRVVLVSSLDAVELSSNQDVVTFAVQQV